MKLTWQQILIALCVSTLLVLSALQNDAFAPVAFLLGGVILWSTLFLKSDQSNQFTKFVEMISQGANEILTGNYRFRIASHQKEEFNDLISSFNQFAEKIAKLEMLNYQIVRSSIDAIIVSDIDGTIIEFNPAAEKLFEYNRNEVVGKNLVDTLVYTDHLQSYNRFINDIKKNNVSGLLNKLLDYQLVNRHGVSINTKLFMSTITINDVLHLVTYVHDMSATLETESKLRYMVNNDELTDLPNLHVAMLHIERAMADADKNDRSVVVLKLGVDRFKNINDSLGHEVGDHLLTNVGRRLRNSMRRGDLVSRPGGDQFAIILVDVDRTTDLTILTRKYLDIFSKPFNVDGHRLHITVSVGLTQYPNDADSVEGLLRNAESAMFKAKEKAGINCQFYSGDMRERSREMLYMENELRLAIERDEFDVFYQPQVNLQTNKIVGVEALIRWKHPTMGMVAPLKFIPLAEETGLISIVGEWVMNRACNDMQSLREKKGIELSLAINLSAVQFLEADLVDRIAEILNRTGYPATLLELEITESLLMENLDETARILHILSDQGIRISMDDFGTGYSSLSYLKRFPINTIKVDRSFVQDITSDEDDASIVSATIHMAHSLSLDIVAEGVETEEQLKFLLRRDCDKMQGYYFSHPLSFIDLVELLDDKTPLKLVSDQDALKSGSSKG